MKRWRVRVERREGGVYTVRVYGADERGARRAARPLTQWGDKIVGVERFRQVAK